MVVVNVAGEIVLLNAQVEKQFGYRRDELLGQPVKSLIPEGFAERLVADDLRSAADALAQQIGTGLELVARRKDGTEFPIELMLSPLESPEGILVTAAIRDISVRKAAEEELRRSEERFRTMFRKAPLGIALIDSLTGLIYEVNPRFAEIAGRTLDEMAQVDWMSITHPDDVQEDLDNMARMNAGEIPGFKMNKRYLRPDGSVVWIEMTVASLMESRALPRHLTMIEDISVRKESERHLAQMEAQYRGLLEAAPDAMVVVDEGGEIVLLNVQAEKQFGYRRDELVGQPVKNIIPEGFAERLIADDLRSAAAALAQQIETGLELVARRKDGTEFPIELMLSPLESADGILVTAAIRDISVRKLAEGQLLQAQKLESIGRLAGGIAHDFNNMLFVINGHAEMLDQDLVPEGRSQLDLDEMLRNVRAIREAGERAATLTAQLLAFSRQQVISPTVLDLNAAIKSLEPMVRKLIGEDMRLVLRLGDDAGHIRADAGQLDQILVNLVVNARDAMPDGGTVTVETANTVVDGSNALEPLDVTPGPYVLLVVSDTGIGMDRATREHIFEPFFTTKELGGGTGLGLATAYGIVHQAGGTIRVYSEPGAGSTFRLHFPRVDAPGIHERPTRSATPAVGTGTVLVVEDELVVREMTTQMLERSGYDVVAVATGAEAIARLAGLDARVDVLVTDVIMPHMSGLELAGLVMDGYPDVGIVLLSGFTAQTLNLDQVTSRGAKFVPKPVTSGQLVSAVQGARRSRRTNLDLTELPHTMPRSP